MPFTTARFQNKNKWPLCIKDGNGPLTQRGFAIIFLGGGGGRLMTNTKTISRKNKNTFSFSFNSRKMASQGTGKGQYTLGDKLYQHVATTHCSNKSLHAYWIILWKSFSLQQNFVAAKSCTNSVWLWFFATCCWDKDFYKNSPVHTKWFVAAMCHCNMLLQLVM